MTVKGYILRWVDSGLIFFIDLVYLAHLSAGLYRVFDIR